MGNYIATKPVRFDRNYAVGEIIPEAVVDRRTVKRLMESGKIAPASMKEEERKTLFDMMKYIDEAVLKLFEGVLDIDYDETEPPELQERITACKSVIAEIRNAQDNAPSPPEEPPEGDDSQAYICPVCGKKYGSKSALTRHMKEHEPEESEG